MLLQETTDRLTFVDRLRSSFSEVFGELIPALLGALIIIFAGFLLAVFMALQELGIATDIVTTAFAILFGAIALALALAFGLGNRELAGEITREWYNTYRRERDEALLREAEEEALEEEEDDSPSDNRNGNRPPITES